MKIMHGCTVCSQSFDKVQLLKIHMKKDHSTEDLIENGIDPTTLTAKRKKVNEERLIQMEFADNKTLIKPVILPPPEPVIIDGEQILLNRKIPIFFAFDESNTESSSLASMGAHL